MFCVANCVSKHQDLRLLFLAATISAIAAFASLCVYGFMNDSRGWWWRAWLGLTGTISAVGIWAAHFIGLLAYNPGLPTRYDAYLTLASLLIAMIASIAGFASAAAGGWRAAATGGVIAGSGIAAVHFVGMSALIIPGHLHWNPFLSALAIIIGVGLNSVAMIIHQRVPGTLGRCISAAFLTAAVCGLQFTATTALTVTADTAVGVPMSNPGSSFLTAVVVGVVLAVLTAGLAAAIVANYVAASHKSELESQNRILRLREAELRVQNLRFTTAIDNLTQGLIVFNEKREVVVCNRRYLELYGLSPVDVAPGTPIARLIQRRLDLGLKVGDPQNFVRSRLSGPVTASSSIQEFSDGRRISYVVRPMPDGGGVSTHDDITDREKLHTQLQQQHELLSAQDEALRLKNLQFDTAINNMIHGLSMFDGDHRLVVCNKRYAEMYNLPPELIQPGTSLADILRYREVEEGPSRSEEMARSAAPHGGREVLDRSIHHLNDGRVIECVCTSMPGGGSVITHEDITERRRMDAQIIHMAQHDALTDLPNRLLLRERLDHSMRRAKRGAQLAILCLDLDRFKEVNDTLGHPVGDALLKTVADRLRLCVRETDTIARTGGDEFAIIQDAAGRSEVAVLAERIINALSAPYQINEHQIIAGVSIGVAMAPDDGCDADQLIKKADLALYRAKSEGRGGCRFYEQGMDVQLQRRRELELDLRRALERNEFEIYYQPLVDLSRDQVTGFEALIRWHHPVRGKVPPSEFIPLAEETGLIANIGEWVVRNACKQAAAWPAEIRIAVNLSPVQFKSERIVQMVIAALSESGLAPHRLELEITEAVLLQDSAATLSVLRDLQKLGVRIALDDFGTGYSSLSYLRSFPFDKIKIDRCFIDGLSVNPEHSLAIIRAVVGIGGALGMTTTAEGVESLAQRDIVRAEGCTEMQGYLFSEPKTAAEISSEFFAVVPAVNAA